MKRRTLLIAGAGSLLASGAEVARSGPPVLFVAAHPDDETLMAGVPIAEHVAGGYQVHLLVLTKGEASGATDILNGVGTSSWWGVQHNPAAEGYAPLTRADLGAARVREVTSAAHCLAAGLPGSLTLHLGDLPDGGVTAESAQASILSLCDLIAPGAPVWLKGHTWLRSLEAHRDHLAIGDALRALSTADPTRFSNRRHYILPGYWTDPDLGSASAFWDTPADAAIRSRAINAVRSYSAWNPAAGSFAIGMHSVPSWFDMVAANPRALLHA